MIPRLSKIQIYNTSLIRTITKHIHELPYPPNYHHQQSSSNSNNTNQRQQNQETRTLTLSQQKKVSKTIRNILHWLSLSTASLALILIEVRINTYCVVFVGEMLVFSMHLMSCLNTMPGICAPNHIFNPNPNPSPNPSPSPNFNPNSSYNPTANTKQ